MGAGCGIRTTLRSSNLNSLWQKLLNLRTRGFGYVRALTKSGVSVPVVYFECLKAG